MAEELAAALTRSDVVIFSYGGCPYCRKVTQAYGAKQIPFVEIDYDDLDGATRGVDATPPRKGKRVRDVKSVYDAERPGRGRIGCKAGDA